MRVTVEDVGLDASRVADIVRDQFPQVPAATVAYLGEGYDSTAFEIDGQWVFRFPKRAAVEAQLLQEWRVLPALARQSPLPLPAFCFQGKPSSLFPRHFGGYVRLSGHPAIALDPEVAPFNVWAPVLAQFLSWLHRVPLGEAERLGLQREDVFQLTDEARADALADFEHVKRVAPAGALESWYAYLAAAPPASRPSSLPPVVAHRDLAAEHVLYDAKTAMLTGVIDWSEIAIDDRSVDLAALFHWGGRPLVNAVLETYDGPADEATLERARYLGACRGVGDVTFGLEMQRQEYVDAGLRALALCVGARA
jgi:aminoglycoside phosphotransferase (APT) family kinase protein